MSEDTTASVRERNGSTAITAEFTIDDVYDQAAAIGSDVEQIVSQYGRDVVEDIMPKIVHVLEQLEVYVGMHQKDRDECCQLLMDKERLVIHTKRDEAIQRQLTEKIDYLESLVDSESRGLESNIADLRQENEYLRDDLEIRDFEMLQSKAGAHPGDVEVMLRMKNTIDSQRDTIRQLNCTIDTQKDEIDALQEQSNRLSDINERLRRNTAKLELQVDYLKLNDAAASGESILISPMDDTSESRQEGRQDVRQEVSLEDFDSVLVKLDAHRRNSPPHNNNSNELPVSPARSIASSTTQTDDLVNSPPNSPGAKDPNRPRYTLIEMQKVLDERMTYKIQMQALEEELELYKEIARKSKDGKRLEEDKPSNVRSMMGKFLGK